MGSPRFVKCDGVVGVVVDGKESCRTQCVTMTGVMSMVK